MANTYLSHESLVAHSADDWVQQVDYEAALIASSAPTTTRTEATD
jgi:hypothetical protein